MAGRRGSVYSIPDGGDVQSKYNAIKSVGKVDDSVEKLAPLLNATNREGNQFFCLLAS